MARGEMGRREGGKGSNEADRCREGKVCEVECQGWGSRRRYKGSLIGEIVNQKGSEHASDIKCPRYPLRVISPTLVSCFKEGSVGKGRFKAPLVDPVAPSEICATSRQGGAVELTSKDGASKPFIPRGEQWSEAAHRLSWTRYIYRPIRLPDSSRFTPYRITQTHLDFDQQHDTGV